MTVEEILNEEEKETLLTEKSANLYPRHWDNSKRLWVYDHREKLGLSEKNRDLVVHHKDDDETNFNPDNLVAITRAEHARIGKPALKHEKCRICGAKHFAKGLCQKHYKRIWRKSLMKKINKTNKTLDKK